MHVIPVLDLQAGRIVRAVGGRRHEYRPIESPLTHSSDPVAVAAAFRDQFGRTECYLADLDAIAGKPPALATYAAIRELGIRLWVDAGVRTVGDVEPLLESGVEVLVVGSETVASFATLLILGHQADQHRLTYSLDLRDGRPLGALGSMFPDVWSAASSVVDFGFRRLIVLDLARVGGAGGNGTTDLCTRLRSTYPTLHLYVGGGIRGLDDLDHLHQIGVTGVLVASALHAGRLTPADIATARWWK